MRPAGIILLLACCSCGVDNEAGPELAMIVRSSGLSLGDVHYLDLWQIEDHTTQNLPVGCADLAAATRQIASRTDLRAVPVYSGPPTAVHLKVKPHKSLLFVVEAYATDTGVGNPIGFGCVEKVTLSGGQKKTLDLVIAANNTGA